MQKIEEKLSCFDCRKILVVPSEDVLDREPEGIDVMTPEELFKIAKNSLQNTSIPKGG